MKIAFTMAIATLALMPGPVAANQSGPVTATFDEVSTAGLFSPINDFYTGGTASDGTVGPNLGVFFQTGKWFFTPPFPVIGTPGNSALVPETNFASLDDATGPGYVNILTGFAGTLRFNFQAVAGTTISIYGGLNGTGNLLTSAFLINPGTAPNSFFALNFIGRGQSFTFSNASVGIDDLTFDPSPQTGGVPEPAAWAMLLTGFGLVGGTLRNAKRRGRKTSLTVRYG